MKEQINVVKTTLVTFNSTLNSITTNQQNLFETIKKISVFNAIQQKKNMEVIENAIMIN